MWFVPTAEIRVWITTTATTPAFPIGKLVYSVNCAMGTDFSTITTIIVCRTDQKRRKIIHNRICLETTGDTQAQSEWRKQGLWLEKDMGRSSGRTGGLACYSRSRQLPVPPRYTTDTTTEAELLGWFPTNTFHFSLEKKKARSAQHPWKGRWWRCWCFGFIFSVTAQTLLRCPYILWTTAGPK